MSIAELIQEVHKIHVGATDYKDSSSEDPSERWLVLDDEREVIGTGRTRMEAWADVLDSTKP